FPSAQDCSGQVFALDTAGAFIEPQPKFPFENLWRLPRMTSKSGSWGVHLSEDKSCLTAQCLPTVSAADFWPEIPFRPGTTANRVTQGCGRWFLGARRVPELLSYRLSRICTKTVQREGQRKSI